MSADLAMLWLGVSSLSVIAGICALVFCETDWRRVIATARGQFLSPGASVVSPPPRRPSASGFEATTALTTPGEQS